MKYGTSIICLILITVFFSCKSKKEVSGSTTSSNTKQKNEQVSSVKVEVVEGIRVGERVRGGAGIRRH